MPCLPVVWHALRSPEGRGARQNRHQTCTGQTSGGMPTEIHFGIVAFSADNSHGNEMDSTSDLNDHALRKTSERATQTR